MHTARVSSTKKMRRDFDEKDLILEIKFREIIFSGFSVITDQEGNLF
mgnify:CR=1 FL=1